MPLFQQVKKLPGGVVIVAPLLLDAAPKRSGIGEPRLPLPPAGPNKSGIWDEDVAGPPKRSGKFDDIPRPVPLNKSGMFEDCCVDEEPLFVVPNRSRKKGRVSLRAGIHQVF